MTTGRDSGTVQLQTISELVTNDMVQEALSAGKTYSFFGNLPEGLKEFGTIYICNKGFMIPTFEKINFGYSIILGINLYVPRFLCVGQAFRYSPEKKKLRGLSPRANYTDRAAAAGRRS